jgi:hypothetical protein
MISMSVPAFIVLAIWLFLSGVGGFGYQTLDYRASNALLKDLIVQNWPLVAEIQGTETNIVYYVGYYLPAALIGKMSGWTAANLFIFLWTCVGITLSFAWFWKLSAVDLKKRKRRILALSLLFCLAGGLDAIGYYVLRHNTFDITAHIEWWAYYFQYSSNTTLIYWVPQQAIAAWLLTGIVVFSIYERTNLKYMGVSIASAIIWSPFGVVGIVPYLLLLAIVYLRRRNRRLLLNSQSILFNSASLWIASIFCLYLSSNRFDFPRGFIWNFASNVSDLLRGFSFFYLLEFVSFLILVLVLMVLGVNLSRERNANNPKPVIRTWFGRLKRQCRIDARQCCVVLVAVAVLLILPLIKMGFMNDLVMRASIPSLFIFWAFVSKIVIDANLRTRPLSKALYAVLVLMIIVGSYTGIGEIARSIIRFDLGPPDMATVSTTASAIDLGLVEQRIGNPDSIFYRHLGKQYDEEARLPAPGEGQVPEQY